MIISVLGEVVTMFLHMVLSIVISYQNLEIITSVPNLDIFCVHILIAFLRFSNNFYIFLIIVEILRFLEMHHYNINFVV